MPTGSCDFFRADDLAHERHSWWRLVADFETCREQAHGWDEARVQVVVHGAEIFAGLYRIADFFFETQAGLLDRLIAFGGPQGMGHSLTVAAR